MQFHFAIKFWPIKIGVQVISIGNSYFICWATLTMACTVSKPTFGGCSFKQLCNGSCQSYACDKVIDITKETKDTKGDSDDSLPTLSQITSKLIKHVRKCIKSIEDGKGRSVEQFYIGKTLTHKRKSGKFHRMKSSTWKLSNGISKRFKRHHDNGYGRDGLVVLTVVTRKAIPPIRHNKRFTKEFYACALENRLIQHFLIECDDRRIVNSTLNSGKSDHNRSIGYPLYMAYKLEDCDSESSQSEDSSSEDTDTDAQ